MEQFEGAALVQRTSGGWNPWKVILVFAFLQLVIFGVEWYWFGTVVLGRPL